MKGDSYAATRTFSPRMLRLTAGLLACPLAVVG